MSGNKKSLSANAPEFKFQNLVPQNTTSAPPQNGDTIPGGVKPDVKNEKNQKNKESSKGGKGGKGGNGSSKGGKGDKGKEESKSSKGGKGGKGKGGKGGNGSSKGDKVSSKKILDLVDKTLEEEGCEFAMKIFSCLENWSNNTSTSSTSSFSTANSKDSVGEVNWINVITSVGENLDRRKLKYENDLRKKKAKKNVRLRAKVEEEVVEEVFKLLTRRFQEENNTCGIEKYVPATDKGPVHLTPSVNKAITALRSLLFQIAKLFCGDSMKMPSHSNKYNMVSICNMVSKSVVDKCAKANTEKFIPSHLANIADDWIRNIIKIVGRYVVDQYKEGKTFEGVTTPPIPIDEGYTYSFLSGLETFENFSEPIWKFLTDLVTNLEKANLSPFASSCNLCFNWKQQHDAYQDSILKKSLDSNQDFKNFLMEILNSKEGYQIESNNLDAVLVAAMVNNSFKEKLNKLHLDFLVLNAIYVPEDAQGSERKCWRTGGPKKLNYGVDAESILKKYVNETNDQFENFLNKIFLVIETFNVSRINNYNSWYKNKNTTGNTINRLIDDYYGNSYSADQNECPQGYAFPLLLKKPTLDRIKILSKNLNDFLEEFNKMNSGISSEEEEEEEEEETDAHAKLEALSISMLDVQKTNIPLEHLGGQNPGINSKSRLLEMMAYYGTKDLPKKKVIDWISKFMFREIQTYWTERLEEKMDGYRINKNEAMKHMQKMCEYYKAIQKLNMVFGKYNISKFNLEIGKNGSFPYKKNLENLLQIVSSHANFLNLLNEQEDEDEDEDKDGEKFQMITMPQTKMTLRHFFDAYLSSVSEWTEMLFPFLEQNAKSFTAKGFVDDLKKTITSRQTQFQTGVITNYWRKIVKEISLNSSQDKNAFNSKRSLGNNIKIGNYFLNEKMIMKIYFLLIQLGNKWNDASTFALSIIEELGQDNRAFHHNEQTYDFPEYTYDQLFQLYFDDDIPIDMNEFISNNISKEPSDDEFISNNISKEPSDDEDIEDIEDDDDDEEDEDDEEEDEDDDEEEDDDDESSVSSVNICNYISFEQSVFLRSQNLKESPTSLFHYMNKYSFYKMEEFIFNHRNWCTSRQMKKICALIVYLKAINTFCLQVQYFFETIFLGMESKHNSRMNAVYPLDRPKPTDSKWGDKKLISDYSDLLNKCLNKKEVRSIGKKITNYDLLSREKLYKLLGEFMRSTDPDFNSKAIRMSVRELRTCFDNFNEHLDSLKTEDVGEGEMKGIANIKHAIWRQVGKLKDFSSIEIDQGLLSRYSNSRYSSSVPRYSNSRYSSSVPRNSSRFSSSSRDDFSELLENGRWIP